jgi:uncharacterized protein (TIGR02145 family)
MIINHQNKKSMKKIIVLFILIFAIAKVHAQNYQISFDGAGASTVVDSVLVKNLTQCTDTILNGGDILNLIVTVGINELNQNANSSLNIFPNPASSNCVMDFEATGSGNTTIALFDLNGKRILFTEEFLSKGHQSYLLSGICSGVYLLKVESEKYSYASKFVSCNLSAGKAEIKHIESNSIIDIQNAESIKSEKSTIDMPYTIGDRLLFTGFSSGIYRTLFILVPTMSQTVTFNFVPCTDANNNNYAVVQIGTQIWMAENLNATKYRNGDSIPHVADEGQWNSLTTDAYCDYNNDASNSDVYGRLYNWYAVDDSLDITPPGWHVPTHAEWTTLSTYLGGENVAGGKLKEACSLLWASPNAEATNESGFSALPGGSRNYNGAFYYIGQVGYWWTATESNPTYAWHWYTGYDFGTVYNFASTKNYGMALRCVKD